MLENNSELPRELGFEYVESVRYSPRQIFEMILSNRHKWYGSMCILETAPNRVLVLRGVDHFNLTFVDAVGFASTFERQVELADEVVVDLRAKGLLK